MAKENISVLFAKKNYQKRNIQYFRCKSATLKRKRDEALKQADKIRYNNQLEKVRRQLRDSIEKFTYLDKLIRERYEK